MNMKEGGNFEESFYLSDLEKVQCTQSSKDRYWTG
jgi:hypothetical protein